jgi:hydroxypyruvate isomerase
MPRFSANISIMFMEHDFLGRFQASSLIAIAAYPWQIIKSHVPWKRHEGAVRRMRTPLSMAMIS